MLNTIRRWLGIPPAQNQPDFYDTGAEISFDFVLLRRDNQPISYEAIDRISDAFIAAVEKEGFSAGGGISPLKKKRKDGDDCFHCDTSGACSTCEGTGECPHCEGDGLVEPKPPFPEPPANIQSIFAKMEEGGELTREELRAVIDWECIAGRITLEELQEINRTRIWPKGKWNAYAADALMLLEMLGSEREQSHD